MKNFIFNVSRERDWISELSQEGQRMLMQEGMRQELWVQEERYEVPQWKECEGGV